jgi:MGT family glycosyltransferase
VARLGRALIYVTFGTVLGYMSIAAETYAMALKAVGRMNARVLLTVGRRFDASTLGSVPANVRVKPWIDQARVLDHADLVVCHGGSGTTLAALAAGVPLVMVPLFADQFENSRRIAKAGAGRVVATQTRTGGARSIAAAAAPEISRCIEDVLGDVTYSDRARAIAAEMTATPTVEEVLARLTSEHR